MTQNDNDTMHTGGLTPGRIVENVPLPRGMNSVLACLTSALRASGQDVTYEYLMGVSSRAFRLQFNWCPSAPHSHCGFNTFTPALQATGYEARSCPLAVWEEDTRAQRKATDDELAAARKAVQDSIAAGMPVLYGSEECGLLVGWAPQSADNPTGWLHRPGPLGPPPPEDAPYAHPVEKLPWEVCILQKSAEAPPRRQSIVWSLRTAVRNARKADQDGYAMGFAAWDRWIRELGDLRSVIAEPQEYLDKFDTEESAPFEIQLGNAWCYDSLIDARRCAAKYLRSVSELFGQDAAGHLRLAADAYDSVVDALTQGIDCPTLIAPYPWMKDQTWTQERRREQAARLEAALNHERTAIDEIEKALTTEGVAG